MRLMYLGAGEFGLPTLKALHAEHEIVAVVTQPDKPAGRKRVMTPTAIAKWATEQGIEVLKSDDVNTPEFVAKIGEYEVDASVVIAFGQKLSPELIGQLGKLAVNLHSSLLPKYRGAAPINWAMIQGEDVTGVSVIGLAQRMDAGEVYGVESLEIHREETAGELHDRLSELGPDVVLRVLQDLKSGDLKPLEQDHMEATRAPKFKKSDGTVDLNLSAKAVRCRVHGLTPWPGCRVQWECMETGKSQILFLRRVTDNCEMRAQERAEVGMVLEDMFVVVGQGEVIKLLEVQAAGTKLMSVEEFAKGHKLGAGDRLRMLDA
ncbi:Methionyl-tRNA formyltransferase [Poriferisphaera corsica]|uniref:Methionyl-tRNA formyltransferase n=1 Tax=Poriferisphaera corsica TaxID=2528020 RepID=A0A517YUP3_9BACT|nr:methionyl-tRNA formyltransferase [Poriferisphaera corsica]QDU33937.1 Methionyl-tRNA formyltransferase [Poriferisphaera corsica]